MPEFRLVVTLLDDDERVTTRTYKSIPTLADHATAMTSAATLVGHLEALTKLQVLYYDVAQRTIEADSLVAGANVDAGATFTLRKEDQLKAPLQVPDVIDSVRTGDGRIDLTATEVSNFLGNFTSASDWTFSDGEQSIANVTGKLDK